MEEEFIQASEECFTNNKENLDEFLQCYKEANS